MEARTRSSRTFLAGIGGMVAVLVVVAIVLALRPVPQLDPATPEGAVQGYLEAVLDDDIELARTFMADDVTGRCDMSEFAHRSDEGANVVIVHTEARGDRVRVEVEITETYGTNPLDVGSNSFDEIFVLEEHGGRWLMAEPPWPVHYCPEASP